MQIYFYLILGIYKNDYIKCNNIDVNYLISDFHYKVKNNIKNSEIFYVNINIDIFIFDIILNLFS